MDTLWFRGCKTDEDKENRKKEVEGFKPVLRELDQLIAEYLPKRPSVRNYDSPNWMAEQIAVNEYNAALDRLRKLIEIKPE